MKNQIHPKFLPAQLALFLVAILLLGSSFSVNAQAPSEVVRILDPYSGLMGVANAHIVKRGESLYKIARQYKITVDEIKKLNGLTSNLIHPDDRLAVSYPVAQETATSAQRLATAPELTKPTSSASRVPESIRLYQYADSKAESPFSAAEPILYAAASSNVNKQMLAAATTTRGVELTEWVRRSSEQPLQQNASKLRSARQISSKTRTVEIDRPRPISTPQKRVAKRTKSLVPQTIYHEVQAGESMYNIAERYGMSVDELREASGVPAALVGQILVIKPNRIPGFQTQKLSAENRRVRSRTVAKSNTKTVDEELLFEGGFTSLDVLKQPESQGNLNALGVKKSSSSPRGDLDNVPRPRTNARTVSNRGTLPSAKSLPPAAMLQSPENRVIGTTMEAGQYGRYANAGLTHTRFYGAHKQLPIGSQVRMQIPNNAGFIVVEIVDRLSPSSPHNISLSPACRQILEQGDRPNSVVIYYD